jgi:hypothetical protein
VGLATSEARQMDLLNKEDLIQVAECHEPPCVSLFMPTIRAGHQVEQNLIRFRNLLRQAEVDLAAGGLKSLQVQELLKPARALSGQAPF